MADLLVDQVGRHDADHLAAGGQGGVGHRPHQAHLAAAVDQGQALFGDQRARRDRFGLEGRVVAGGRSAIDTDAVQRGPVSPWQKGNGGALQ